MLFDALINLFKTICIGIIAFSPILVYKLTEETITNNYNKEISNQFDLEQTPDKNENQEAASEDNSRTGIFKNSTFFQTPTTIPDLPCLTCIVAVPIDDYVWLLIIGVLVLKYKKQKLLAINLNIRRYI